MVAANAYETTFERHFPFWAHLTPAEKRLLCENTDVVAYPKGTHIHSGNGDCIGVLLVIKGHLRTYLLSDDGREITLYRLFSGDTCILSASCLLSTITFDVFIDAEEDCEVLRISSCVFRQLSEGNIHVELFSYKLATVRFSDVMWAMQQILFLGADKRLAIFLLEELSKSNADEIRLTHEQIAKYMGTAREVVSRMLKYFASEGIVESSRGAIRILDKKRLRGILE